MLFSTFLCFFSLPVYNPHSIVIFSLMLTALKARTGTVLKIDGGLYLVVKHEMRRGGRGARPWASQRSAGEGLSCGPN